MTDSKSSLFSEKRQEIKKSGHPSKGRGDTSQMRMSPSGVIVSNEKKLRTAQYHNEQRERGKNYRFGHRSAGREMGLTGGLGAN